MTIDSAEVVELVEAAKRVRTYLAARATTKGIDFETINGLDKPGEQEEVAYLLSSDLTLILDALGEYGAPPVTAPFAVGDTCSYLRGKDWLIGTVQWINPVAEGEWEAGIALNDGTEIKRTLDVNGTGGGVAPLRDR